MQRGTPDPPTTPNSLYLAAGRAEVEVGRERRPEVGVRDAAAALWEVLKEVAYKNKSHNKNKSHSSDQEPQP